MRLTRQTSLKSLPGQRIEMEVKALNCPNCGAAVADNANHCEHCRSRLKTMSCPECYGTIFQGNKFCPLCGGKATAPKITARKVGDCPRCKKKLQLVEVEEISFSECERCDGVWMDAETFEIVCANNEKQAAVLGKLDDISNNVHPAKIQYVPCPDCKHLMNRNNFARTSGTIVDICKTHGVWFDAEELPRIIEFIRKGGLDYAREKQKSYLDAEKAKIRAEKFKTSVDRYSREKQSRIPQSGTTMAIREFIEFIIDR